MLQQLVKPMKTRNKRSKNATENQPLKESIKAVSKEKPKKVLMCNKCANKKGGLSFPHENLCPALGAVCRTECKTKNHFQDSKECERLQTERQGHQTNANSQEHQGNHLC